MESRFIYKSGKYFDKIEAYNHHNDDSGSHFTKFDINTLTTNSHILIITNNMIKAGKSALIKRIATHLNINHGYLLSPKDKQKKNLSNLQIFEDSTYYNYNDSTLETFIKNIDHNTKNLITINDDLSKYVNTTIHKMYKYKYLTSLICTSDSINNTITMSSLCFDYIFFSIADHQYHVLDTTTNNNYFYDVSIDDIKNNYHIDDITENDLIHYYMNLDKRHHI
jgi:hypothetical protein